QTTENRHQVGARRPHMRLRAGLPSNECFLDQILRIRHAAQHPVCDGDQERAKLKEDVDATVFFHSPTIKATIAPAFRCAHANVWVLASRRIPDDCVMPGLRTVRCDSHVPNHSAPKTTPGSRVPMCVCIAVNATNGSLVV